jgi:hypothetical protein
MYELSISTHITVTSSLDEYGFSTACNIFTVNCNKVYQLPAPHKPEPPTWRLLTINRATAINDFVHFTTPNAFYRASDIRELF